MILRKPYKFLLKHFKLIHLILTTLMVYIIYRFSRIVNFFDVAIASSTGVLSTNPTASLFDIYIYIAIFLVVVASIGLIFLLSMKKKSVKLYIATIIGYVVAFIFLAYSYNVIGNMEVKVVDPKILRNIRDFVLVVSMIQAIFIVLYGIRALGLDIKNFNFKDDLKEFDIVEEDNEEFELNVNVDVNKVHRKVNKGKRFLHYFYVENRYLFFFISSICVVTLSLIIYLSLGVYSKKYTENEFFTTQDFFMAINKAYVTNLDYDGNEISSNKSFVVLAITIKTNGMTEKQLNLARPELVVGYNKYYHDGDYSYKFVDIGSGYKNEYIGRDFKKFLLIYPIDKNDIDKKMMFRYVDKGSITDTEPKTISVEIVPKNLDVVTKTKKFELGDTINFDGSILGETTLTLNQKTISDLFKINYTFCVNSDECYPSIEYLKPDIVNNYDKTLLRINGNIEWDSETVKSKISNIFSFIDLYGYFEYTIDGVKKKDNTTLKEVKSIRVDESDTYYIELIKEVEKAQELTLVLKVRDCVYYYKIF